MCANVHGLNLNLLCVWCAYLHADLCARARERERERERVLCISFLSNRKRGRFLQNDFGLN